MWHSAVSINILVQVQDINLPARLVSLRRLSISGNCLETVSSFPDSRHLRFLGLFGNRNLSAELIIGVLQKSPNLRTIHVAGTGVMGLYGQTASRPQLSSSPPPSSTTASPSAEENKESSSPGRITQRSESEMRAAVNSSAMRTFLASVMPMLPKLRWVDGAFAPLLAKEEEQQSRSAANAPPATEQ